MAKAVAIVPVGHDFPPFSANKGGSIEGSKLFLLTFDLAFQIQEQVRALEAGGDVPADIGKDMASRRRYITLLKRLLRQWAIPPARQFNRLPSRARVVMCAELLRRLAVQPRAAQRRRRAAEAGAAADALPGHQPHARRATRCGRPTRIRRALRIGELVALRVEGRDGLQVAIVRWFRNTLQRQRPRVRLRSCCPTARRPRPRRWKARPDGKRVPVVVLPLDASKSGAEDIAAADHRRRGRVRARAGDRADAAPARRASRCSPSSSSKVRASRSTSSWRSPDRRRRGATATTAFRAPPAGSDGRSRSSRRSRSSKRSGNCGSRRCARRLAGSR